MSKPGWGANAQAIITEGSSPHDLRADALRFENHR